MLRTFNPGIGMIVVVTNETADDVPKRFGKPASSRSGSATGSSGSTAIALSSPGGSL